MSDEKNENIKKSTAAWDKLVGENFDPNDICINDYYDNKKKSSSNYSSPVRRKYITSRKSAFSNRNPVADVSQKINECRTAYKNIGLIGNVIDIMTDFALEGFQITHEVRSAERLFQRWAETVDLYSIVEEILRNIFRDSNVPILTYNAEISKNDVANLKNNIKRTNSDIFYDDSLTNKNVIPYKFDILDIESLYMDNIDLFGNKTYYYMFDRDIIQNTFNSDNPETQALAKELKSKLTERDYDRFIQTGEYPLSSRDLELIYYKKDSFENWANPMLWRIIDDLKFKKTLRNMDISVAESITNSITIFKLGSVEEGFTPSKERLSKFATMLKNPSKSKQIVWDNLVEIDSNDKDVGEILNDVKYKQVNNDILAGLGISEVLIGGDGGNYSNSFLSCRTLLERLETGRNKVLRWVRSQLKKVAKGTNIKRMPFVKFEHMSLRDETAEKKMLLELVDRNIVSYETLLERFGEDLDIEIKRMRREDNLRRKYREKYPHTLRKLGKFGPQMPFSPTFSDEEEENGQENGEENDAKSLPSMQGPQGEDGGRPGNDGTPQKVQRDTNPKGMSWKQLLPYAVSAYKRINCVTKNKEEAYKILCSLSKEEVVNLDINKFIDAYTKNGLNYTEAPAKLDRCVDSVYEQLKDEYKERTGNSPSEDKKQELESSAWAICSSRMKDS